LTGSAVDSRELNLPVRKENAMDRPGLTLHEHPDLAQMQARYDWLAARPGAQFVEGATLLAGLYLAISPWVVGFQSGAGDLRITDLVCGITVALLAVGYAAAYGRTHGLSWVTPVIGAWTIVAPWVVLGSDVNAGTILSNVITGALIVILGIATVTMVGRQPASRTAATRRP
jgi:SPW repeat-containing protein